MPQKARQTLKHRHLWNIIRAVLYINVFGFASQRRGGSQVSGTPIVQYNDCVRCFVVIHLYIKHAVPILVSLSSSRENEVNCSMHQHYSVSRAIHKYRMTLQNHTAMACIIHYKAHTSSRPHTSSNSTSQYSRYKYRRCKDSRINLMNPSFCMRSLSL
jgi:hypothetical protein